MALDVCLDVPLLVLLHPVLRDNELLVVVDSVLAPDPVFDVIDKPVDGGVDPEHIIVLVTPDLYRRVVFGRRCGARSVSTIRIVVSYVVEVARCLQIKTTVGTVIGSHRSARRQVRTNNLRCLTDCEPSGRSPGSPTGGSAPSRR